MAKPRLADPRKPIVITINPPKHLPMSGKDWELIKRRASEAVQKVLRESGYDFTPGDDP